MFQPNMALQSIKWYKCIFKKPAILVKNADEVPNECFF